MKKQRKRKEAAAPEISSDGRCSTHWICTFLNRTPQRLHQIAAEGKYFPKPERGRWLVMATLRGFIRHLEDLLAKKDKRLGQEDLLYKRARRRKIEVEAGVIEGRYLPKVEVMRAVQLLAESQKRLLYAKLKELPSKLHGADAIFIGEALLKAADDICALTQTQPTPWTDESN
jgi:hypothetical protein